MQYELQDEVQDEFLIGYTRFKETAKMLGHTYDIPHMKALELLARVFGYSSFHEVIAQVGPNGKRDRGKPPMSAGKLEQRLVHFFGPINGGFSPRLTEKLLKLARLNEEAAQGPVAVR